MDRKTLETKKISELRTIAQTLGIENSESLKKTELINSIAGNETTSSEGTKNTEPVEKKEEKIARPAKTVNRDNSEGTIKNERKPRNRHTTEVKTPLETADVNPVEKESTDVSAESTAETPVREEKKPVHRHERVERTNTPNEGANNQQHRHALLSFN